MSDVGRIIKLASGTKFIETFDNLVLAKPEDYAALHGSGGKDHAPKSTIKFKITDYTKKDSSGTEFASFNMERSQVDLQLKVAADFATKSPEMIRRERVQAIVDHMRAVTPSKGESVSYDTFVGVGKMLADLLAYNEDPDYEKSFDLNFNTYRPDENGYCPYAVMRVTHTPYYKGKLSMYPWCIRITNAKAKASIAPNGKTNYSGLIDKTELFINLSNDQYYKLFNETVDYKTEWRGIAAQKLVPQGRAMLQAERKAYYDAKQQ